MLDELYKVLQDRKENAPAGSYTVELLSSGTEGILRKIHEETLEVSLAAAGQGSQRLVEETADLLYHLLVLLVSEGIELDDVWTELRARRHGPEETGGGGSP